MQTIDIPIQPLQWLSDALLAQGYKNIPANVILKKTLPGLGATYMEIKAKRHSIIIEPNVPVILGKTKDKPKLLAIWEECTETDIKNYLKDNTIRYKKLLTTPEGYKKIKSVCAKKDVKIDIYNYFFCLFDECEKIVQDINFRNEIAQPINDFFLFTNKAFVSATPIPMSHPEFVNQNFDILKVNPQYNYRKNIDLIITNNYETDVFVKINELKNSDCVCIFLNKTDSIEKLVNTLKLKDESKIFCSNDSVTKLKKLHYTNVFDQIDLPLKKYNFFTCRFFSGLDIEIRRKPDILILTNLHDANYTMIDPYTEAIQIYGRFRDKYCRGQVPFNSLTHITNVNPNMTVQNKAETDTMIQTWKQTYDHINNQLQSATNSINIKALKSDLQKLNYTELLDDSGNFNYFSLDNLYNGERVKRFYTDSNRLIKNYIHTGHFIVNSTINEYLFPLVCAFQSGKLTASEKRKHIVEELENLYQYKIINPAFDIESIKNIFRQEGITIRESGDLIVDAYDYLGKTIIDSIGYSKSAEIKKATQKAKIKAKEKQLFSVIQSEIKQQYAINSTASKNDIKDFLQDVYNLNGIDITVTHNTINNYCRITSNNSKIPSTYTIKEYL
jgi:hypothetical protein